MLVDGNEPDPRTGALVALLYAVDRAHKTVPHDGVTDREVKKRAKEVAEGQWAAKAVKDAIAAATAATVAAMTAATAGAAADVELAEVGDQLGELLAPALGVAGAVLLVEEPGLADQQRGAAAVALGQLELDRRHRLVGVGAS